MHEGGSSSYTYHWNACVATFRLAKPPAYQVTPFRTGTLYIAGFFPNKFRTDRREVGIRVRVLVRFYGVLRPKSLLMILEPHAGRTHNLSIFSLRYPI